MPNAIVATTTCEVQSERSEPGAVSLKQLRSVSYTQSRAEWVRQAWYEGQRRSRQESGCMVAMVHIRARSRIRISVSYQTAGAGLLSGANLEDSVCTMRDVVPGAHLWAQSSG